jgi:hypothetical protein
VRLLIAALSVLVPISIGTATGAGSSKSCAEQLPAMYISGSYTLSKSRCPLDASAIFDNVWIGHGVAPICRKADDSYRGRSRWGHLVNPPRGGFFIADVLAREPPSGAIFPASLPASHKGTPDQISHRAKLPTAISAFRLSAALADACVALAVDFFQGGKNG